MPDVFHDVACAPDLCFVDNLIENSSAAGNGFQDPNLLEGKQEGLGLDDGDDVEYNKLGSVYLYNHDHIYIDRSTTLA